MNVSDRRGPIDVPALAKRMAEGDGPSSRDIEEEWSRLPNAVIEGPGPVSLAVVFAVFDAMHEPDEGLLGHVAIWLLEPLLDIYILATGDDTLWAAVEQRARDDHVFRRSLSMAWHLPGQRVCASPYFVKHTALMEELRERWPVSLRFTVHPRRSEGRPTLDWFGLAIDGDVPSDELARMLRDMADRIERPGPSIEDYPTDAIKLLISPDFESMRGALEEAVAEAGVEVVASAPWERAGWVGVTVKYRYVPDRDDEQGPPTWRALKSALPRVWGVISARQSDAVEWCYLTVDIRSPLLPDPVYAQQPEWGMRRYVFSHKVPADPHQPSAQVVEQAIDEMTPAPTDGRWGDMFMLAKDGWGRMGRRTTVEEAQRPPLA